MKFALSLILLVPVLSHAQSNAADAAIDGYVADPSGASVPNAKVTATAIRTNQTFETSTDPNGYYRFSLLRIGEYNLRASAPSFADYRREGIVLNVGREVRLNIALAVAATSESVTVKADGSMLSTAVTGMGETLNEAAGRNLPIASRNIYNLHLVGPGIKGLPSSNAATTVFYTGGLTRTTWTVDGIDSTSRRNARQIRMGVITPEAVEEMQLLSGGTSAEFGRSAGAIINVVTRGGTNQFHGSGMWMYRPNALVARSPLAAASVDQSWWFAAGNFAGPIVRDRLCFFLNDEYNPYREPQPVTITAANAQALGLSAEDTANPEYGETYHSPSAKVNFQFNPRNSGFVRYGQFSNSQPAGRTGLTLAKRTTDYADKQNTGAVQWTSILTPSLLSESRFGVNRRIETRSPAGKADANGAFINIQGVANIGVNPLAFNEGIEESIQGSQNFIWTKGRHTVKAGIDYENTSLAVTNSLNRTFTFNGLAAATGRPALTPLDQYLRTLRSEIDPATGRLYTFTQLTQQTGDPRLTLRFNFVNWFAQDEFRMSRRLILSFGLRQEMLFLPEMDRDAPFALSRTIPSSVPNFAPRFGFSFLPFGGDSRTVIRGSYGIFYDTPGLNLLIDGAINNGHRVQTYAIPGTDARAPRYPSLFEGSDTALQTAPSITAYSPDFRVMYGQNANLTIERELFYNFSLGVQYSWWGHRAGIYTRDINLGAPVRLLADGRPVFQATRGRPDVRFAAINLLESGGSSNYNGLDLTIRGRLTDGLQFTATWTWSHALGDSDMQGGALSDPSSRRRDYGNLDGDVRHNLNFAVLYAPRLTERRLSFLNGWEISSIGFWNSGYPIDPRAGVDLNSDLTLNDRNIGTSKNAGVGRDYLQFDARLLRRFRWRDTHSLELIAESDNLFNTLNANCTAACTGAVVNLQTAADFGRVTTARTGRRVQFGLRYSF